MVEYSTRIIDSRKYKYETRNFIPGFEAQSAETPVTTRCKNTKAIQESCSDACGDHKVWSMHPIMDDGG